MPLLRLDTIEDILAFIEVSILDQHWNVPKADRDYTRLVHVKDLANTMYNEVTNASAHGRDPAPYHAALDAFIREMAEITTQQIDAGGLNPRNLDCWIVERPDEVDAENERLRPGAGRSH